MKHYVIYQTSSNGKEMYLKEDGTFTETITEAETYEIKWYIQLIHVILKILIAFGITDKVRYKSIK